MTVKKKKPLKKHKVAVSGKKSSGKGWTTVEWVCIGCDVSMSSISLGGLAKTRDGKLRTGAISRRWTKDTDYFVRLKEAANAHDLVHDLFENMKVMAELDEIAFAVEEAVAIGYLQKAQSAWVKQQLQISGSFLGGLLKWGYRDIVEIQANQWQAVVANDLGITTHHTKWNPTKTEGKFRAKEWIEKFHPSWDGHWPDIIKHPKLGLISKPSDSRAKGIQSDDRYEALAMAQWLRNELRHKW